MNRQYSPEEVSAILKEAAAESGNRSGGGRGDGLTLAELQTIGADSDIDAAAIRRAAARLDARTLEPVKRRMLGINVGASHAVRLQRPMTDSEFAALVSDCRRIFDARGKVTDHDGYREWRNGNLRVWTEQDPHSGSSLLSMQSTQGLMRSMIGGGGILMLWAIISAVGSFFETGGDAVAIAITLAVAALGVLGTAAVATRSWSSTREEQMEELGERALERQVQVTGHVVPESTDVESGSARGEDIRTASDHRDRTGPITPSEAVERERSGGSIDDEDPTTTQEAAYIRRRQR